MADNPITTPLPADLPTNWAYGQTVAPTGAEVGLTRQHGYNYLMEQVNAAQSAANLLGAAFEGVPSKAELKETLEREISNPNLLENWDFRNPVNQNGKGEYTGKGVWTADRWITSGNQGIKVTIQNRNLMITSETNSDYKGISQPLMKGTELFAGKTVTISALVEENAVGKIEMFIGNTSNPSNAGVLYGLSVFTEDAGLITSTVTLPNTFSEPILTFTLGVAPGVSGGHLGSFKVVAAKLELGDHQTLARKNDLGEWEIIDPPNYDLQYALCSQYNPATGEWQGINANHLGGIPAAGYATQDWTQQSQAQYLSLKLSDTGDDTTADGTAAKPFKTINAALKMYRHPKISFYCDTEYTFSGAIIIANRSISFRNGNWHMKGLIYLYSSFLAWQGCTVNWYAGFRHIQMQGVCGFFFGDYYGVVFNALSQNGTPATEFVTIITAFNTNVNDAIATQSPFAAAVSQSFTLGKQLRLFSSSYGRAIVLWRPIQSTISGDSYLYNSSTAMDQIGTSGVYVLK